MNVLSSPGRIIVGVGILLVSFLLHCGKEDTTGPDNQPTPPEVPPASTFIIDFESFPDTSGILAELAMPLVDTTRHNWGWAAINVAVWNTILRVTLAVPVAAFLESFHHPPVRQPDGSWHWTYSFRVAGILHTARLEARTVEGGIQWDMFISKENAYTDFHWFEGFSDLPNTSGTWTLNLNPNDPIPFLRIEWQRDVQTETVSIRYTNIVPNSPDNGSYIFYGVSAGSPYDRFYDILSAIDNNLTEIEWNHLSLIGRIKDPRHFGDDTWHCWDELLFDAVCP